MVKNSLMGQSIIPAAGGVRRNRIFSLAFLYFLRQCFAKPLKFLFFNHIKVSFSKHALISDCFLFKTILFFRYRCVISIL